MTNPGGQTVHEPSKSHSRQLALEHLTSTHLFVVLSKTWEAKHPEQF